jgi:hypothetical protein
MDVSCFDIFSRILAAASSRRSVTAAVGGALTFALAAASGEEVAAKKKCPPCKKRKQGRCKGKKPDGTACTGGTCQGGRCVPTSPVCPPVCPVCQACNPAIGQCVSQNGQPGQDCAAPKVCCSGGCCEPPNHFCNGSGLCATCEQVCPDNCAFCFARAEGGTSCGDAGSTCIPGPPCSSNAGCSGGDMCVTSATNRITNVTSQSCGQPVGTGVCWSIAACFL